MPRPPRFVALESVLMAPALSLGAKTLYGILHVLARDEGWCEPTREQLAHWLGNVTDRAVRKWLLELEGTQHVRRSGRARFMLGWSVENPVKIPYQAEPTFRLDPPNRNPRSAKAEPTFRLDERIKVLGTQVFKNEQGTVRCACGGYFETSADAPGYCDICRHCHDRACGRCSLVVSPLEEVRTLLAGYVRECGLSWAPPDDAICQPLLDQVGLPALYPALKDLLRNQRAAPGRSYGWFLAVLARRKVSA